MNTSHSLLRALSPIGLALALTLVALVTLGLAAPPVTPPAPAAAHDNIICVGSAGDYQTIQEAVNAAQDGDTIRLASGTFEENVVITGSVTIIGEWLPDCSEPSGVASEIHPVTGRAITIDPGDRTDVVVVIDSVSAIGDATGLGGAEPIDAADPPHIDVAQLAATQVSLAMPALAADAQSPGGQPPADWREQLVQLAATGALPGATPDEVRARIAALDNVQLTAPAPVTTVGGTLAAVGDEVDCGGALYAKGASVHLRDFGSSWSVASSAGDGYGGAVCIIDPPVDGAVIEGGQINGNKASTAGVGIGGAVFIRGGAAGSTRIDGVIFFDNIASRTATGWGGAVAVIDTPQPVLTGGEECVFGFNVASRAANGLGGGALLLNAEQAVVEYCNFYSNYASGGGAGGTETIDASFGQGGGLYVANSSQSRLTSNIFSFNVAQTTAPKQNQGAYGGGAFVMDSNQVTVADNEFEHNIAGFSAHGAGGGLALIGQYGIAQLDVNNNKFAENWAAVIDYLGSAGGGIFAFHVQDSTFTTNTFTANLVAAMGESGIRVPDAPFPMGGGMTLDEPGDVVIADNVFEENVGSAGGFALGGGLGLRVAHAVTVENNTFRQNAAGTQAIGDGLGGAMAVHVGEEIVVQHNDFLENTGFTVMDDDREPSAALALIGLNLYDIDVPLIELHDVLVDGNRFLDNGRRIALGAAPTNYGVFALGTDVFTVTNNIIAGNTMGGIAVRYSENMPQTVKTRGVIHNNTLYDNGEHSLWLIGPWSDATLKLTNNAIVSHTVAVDGDGLFAPAELVRIDYALLYANGQEIGQGAASAVTMTHAVRSAPGFVAPAGYNFRLMPNSAAIDAGDPAGVPPAPDHDADGTRRPFGPRVDIGAYEWHGTLIYLPLVYKQN